MKNFKGKTAVITGAASGFGLEVARIAAREGMNLVLVDVQAEALDLAAGELQQAGAQVLARKVDVSSAEAMDALGAAVLERFGAPHFVFNNAGVGTGGLIWEQSVKDWQWVLGVNLWGVIHGVRVFTPMMLAQARQDGDYEGHIVNTSSMAGLLNPPNMGPYNVSKHAVVSLSETLYHDLSLVTDRLHCSVLCPYFVPTGIHQSHRNRPGDLANDAPITDSQKVAQAMTQKAVTSGKVSAADVAALVFEGLRERRFYLYSHPQALGMVQTRMEDILQARNPTDPFAATPQIREMLREALRKG
jgi:NAD(P)-dependent dehydrogenase (short-subunit alcohol dehydrogenase family)